MEFILMIYFDSIYQKYYFKIQSIRKTIIASLLFFSYKVFEIQGVLPPVAHFHSP